MGILMAFLGGPFFIYLILKNRRGSLDCPVILSAQRGAEGSAPADVPPCHRGARRVVLLRQGAVHRGADAAFPHGAVTSVVGPNGCGKSTMIKLVDGLLRPQAGEVRIDGVATLSLKAKERARRVAVLAQASRPPAMTVEALVACGRYPYQARQGRLSREDREQVERALELANVARFRD
ncbi:MAG: ATP-binding cassette domain-containing protein [Gordonibacter pamelaeae]